MRTPAAAEKRSDTDQRDEKRDTKQPRRTSLDRATSRDDSLWDIAGVAAYLKLPISAIYKMTARRASVRIPHIRIGGTLRFRPSDVDQWLTLLTTSNIEALSKMRQKVSRVTHAHDS
jgi:excisionase family DNA binding protein